MELTILQKILRNIAAYMKYPVIVVLILFIAFAVFSIGWILVEAFTERRHMKYSMPQLLDQFKTEETSIPDSIRGSGLLLRQKKVLLELTGHPGFNREMLTSLADNLLENEQRHYDLILKTTGLVSKLAPMAGLLGTLIPLGPGIIALGNGDTYTLSESMLTAFDTTVAGLLAASVCLVIHTIRNHWYDRCMSDLETLVDCLLEIRLEHGPYEDSTEETIATSAGGTSDEQQG